MRAHPHTHTHTHTHRWCDGYWPSTRIQRPKRRENALDQRSQTPSNPLCRTFSRAVPLANLKVEIQSKCHLWEQGHPCGVSLRASLLSPICTARTVCCSVLQCVAVCCSVLQVCIAMTETAISVTCLLAHLAFLVM